MTKEHLRQNITKIKTMQHEELRGFMQNLYLNKQDINTNAFRFLELACDLRMAELMDINTEVVCSDIDDLFQDD